MNIKKLLSRGSVYYHLAASLVNSKDTLSRDMYTHYRGVRRLQRLEMRIENPGSPVSLILGTEKAKAEAKELEPRLDETGKVLMREILLRKGAQKIWYDEQNRLCAEINGKAMILHRYSHGGIGAIADVESEIMLLVDDPKDPKDWRGTEHKPYTRSIWVTGDSLYVNFRGALRLALFDSRLFSGLAVLSNSHALDGPPGPVDYSSYDN